MHDLDLSGELVVVSGGAGGLGVPICRRLAALGASVVAVDVALAPEVGERIGAASEPSAHDAAPAGEGSRRGGEIDHVRADVSELASCESLLEGIEQRYGRLPSVVCCHAGVVDAHGILDYPVEEFDRLFRVNVRGAFVLAQAAARRWRDAALGGHLIFTSSWVQDHPWPEIGPYCASKAAVHALMRNFAKELAPLGIRANAVLPGIVGAGMALRQWEEDPDYRRRAGTAIALGELQSPESVADAFAFLCSPLASYMTGSALRVDGGTSLGPL